MAGEGDSAERVRPARGAGLNIHERLPEAVNASGAGERVRLAAPSGRWREFTQRTGAMLRSCLAEEVEFGHLFYWVPVFMGAGSILWFSARETPSTLVICLLLPAFACATHLLRFRHPVLGAACAGLALLCAGALAAAWETRRAGTIILDTPVTTTVTGTVTGREAVAGGRWRYTVDLDSTEQPRLKRAPARVTLTAPGRDAPIDLGATVRGRARLLPPSGPALAGLNDFAFDAYFSGSGAIGFFYGRPDQVRMTDAFGRTALQSFRLHLEELRGRISARIRAVLPGDTGAFAASMITDDRRAISRETTEALQLAGLTHVVAISGLNMALAAGIFFVGIRALLSLSQEVTHRFPVKKIAAAGALVTVTGYYLISGFAVSAERAYIMMAIMLTAAIFGRPSISLRNVALSALVILALSPSAVLGPGFQMSFAATLALVVGYSAWQKHREQRESRDLPAFVGPLSLLSGFLGGVLATSLIGGLSTALFSIEHFHRIAVWGLPANLFAMPIISLVVMPAGLLALMLMPVGLDWLPLMIMGAGLDLVLAIARWAASLGGDVVTGRMHGWLYLGLASCLVLLGLLRSRLRVAALGAGATLLCVNWMVPPVPRPDLIVHEDGRLAALVRGDAVATTASRPPAFVFDQWQRALPVSRHMAPILETGGDPPARRLDIRQRQAEIARLRRDLADLPTNRFRCREGRWCVAQAGNGARLVVMELRDLVGIACDLADLVVTPSRLPWTACRSGATLLSAETLRRSGTLEIWLLPENRRGFRVISSLGEGDRPWYIHRIYDWRSGTFVLDGDQSRR